MVLAGLKALLEHGIRLNLVLHRFPKGIESHKGGGLAGSLRSEESLLCKRAYVPCTRQSLRSAATEYAELVVRF